MVRFTHFSIALGMVSALCMFARADEVYFSDFEADDGGFVGTGDWEWGSPSGFDMPPFGNPEPVGGFSGNNAWGTVIGGAHNPDTISSLSMTLDLTNYSNIELAYYEWLDSGGNAFDTAEVVVNGNVELLADGGPTTDWREVVLDLSAYDGQVVTIDFLFTTTAVVERVGWYIDNVSVTGDSAAIPEPATIGALSLLGIGMLVRRRR